MRENEFFCVPEIRKLYIAVENASNQFLKAFDLTFSQSIAIFLLLENAERGGNPITQRDLEQLMTMSNPSVAGVVSRLEAKGFIRRVKLGQDKRFNYLEPTQQSIELKEQLRPFLIESEKRLLNGFSADEKQVLQSFLHRLLENISNG